MTEFHKLKVSRVITETRDAHSIVFDVPAALEHAFRYRPGQFLTLRVPSDRTGSVARCYSLSSAPFEGMLKVTVKRTAGGFGSNWICDQLREGAEIDVLPPSGVFTPKSLDGDFLLLAGGSGITPVMSILKSALDDGTGRIVLVYANRDEQSVIFADELATLAHQHADRLVVIHWLETVQGMPGIRSLRTLTAPYAGFETFICGPEPFMLAAKEALGTEHGRTHIEKFLSLTGNPFESAEVEVVETGETTSLSVTLDDTEHSFTWPRQQKLLDFLLSKGLDAPYSCREGQCSACACRIVAGEVKMLNNEVLDGEDIADGLVLACQSLPLTDDVSVTYE
ncbi:2Fe-2S iron-sulfur cluster-binding protein [Amycolatopsis sp. NPDC059657]|uniref:2Fe-2S iron-sulfur cluster-binding protein n=1 Tax=Amycolatopsis sp. NPDC059657 TaxID=3346899 RepID=UPI00366ACA83